MAASSRLLVASALLLAARPAAAIRKGARSQEGGHANRGCVDTDHGHKNYMGADCSFYTTAEKCIKFPNKFGEDFDPATMCCICGGGEHSQPEPSSYVACPATCFGFTCDDWIGNGGGNTCESLTQQGCDCAGCNCPATDAVSYDDQQPDDFQPSYDYPQTSPYAGYVSLGAGYCLVAEGETLRYERNRWQHGQGCADLCTERGEACSGFASDDMGCALYASALSAADGDQTSYCYAKMSPKQLQQQRLQEQQLQEQQLQEQEEYQPEPHDETPFDETISVIPSADGKQVPAAVSPHFDPLAGNLVDQKYAQSFSFTKNRFMLEKRFELCYNYDERCTTWSAEGHCVNPEYQEWCKLACNMCETPERVSHSVALVSSKSFSFHSSIVVKFGALGGGEIKEYKVSKARVMGVTVNWRVTLPRDDTILYSIVKQSASACKEMGLESCAVWHIYKGRVRDNELVFLGVQRSSTFKFYRSLTDLKQSPESSWSAVVRIPKPLKANAGRHYKVTVLPGEDSGLLLIAAYVVNQYKDLIVDQGTSDFEDSSD